MGKWLLSSREGVVVIFILKSPSKLSSIPIKINARTIGILLCARLMTDILLNIFLMDASSAHSKRNSEDCSALLKTENV